jgi:hypothetical protein
MNTTDELILKEIANEIEKKHNCKVLNIHYVQLLSPCIMAKIEFIEDFHYIPEWLKYSINTICFSEKTIRFTRRVDLFDCFKKLSNQIDEPFIY